MSGFSSNGKRLRARKGDMEKATKKAALDRTELQRELKELTGRSEGDAHRATEVCLAVVCASSSLLQQ